MAHHFNKVAFEAAYDPANPLLSLYCTLVSIELSLKDNQSVWPAGHKIETWLSGINDPGITSLAYQLSNDLNQIYCTDLKGGESFVGLNSYPDLRYVRHESDYAGRTKTEELERALELARDIRQNLTKRGIQ